jgi:hypothetical protein
MNSVVMLNNVDHHDLRVATGYGAAFGDAINQVLIFPTEFEAVAREYPILFRREEQGFRALARICSSPVRAGMPATCRRCSTVAPFRSASSGRPTGAHRR